MKKVMYYITHALMNVGMLCERIWDEVKKFVWWIFAPNAYADLYHDYKLLQEGYEELQHTWEIDSENYERDIAQLKSKLRSCQEELDKLKQA